MLMQNARITQVALCCLTVLFGTTSIFALSKGQPRVWNDADATIKFLVGEKDNEDGVLGAALKEFNNYYNANAPKEVQNKIDENDIADWTSSGMLLKFYESRNDLGLIRQSSSRLNRFSLGADFDNDVNLLVAISNQMNSASKKLKKGLAEIDPGTSDPSATVLKKTDWYVLGDFIGNGFVDLNDQIANASPAMQTRANDFITKHKSNFESKFDPQKYSDAIRFYSSVADKDVDDANTAASTLLRSTLTDSMAKQDARQAASDALLELAIYHGSCPAAQMFSSSMTAVETLPFTLKSIQDSRYLTAKIGEAASTANNEFLYDELANIIVAGVQQAGESRTQQFLVCYLQEVVVGKAYRDLHAVNDAAKKAATNKAYDDLDRVLRYLDGQVYTSDELDKSPISSCDLHDYTQPSTLAPELQKFVTKARIRLLEIGSKN